jgi:hypothetical protein
LALETALGLRREHTEAADNLAACIVVDSLEGVADDRQLRVAGPGSELRVVVAKVVAGSEIVDIGLDFVDIGQT